MKKIGYFSDLHLEESNIQIDFSPFDYIIFAGDISQDFSLLPFLFLKIPNIPTFYIPGNHEYERKNFQLVVPKLKEFEKDFPFLHILQNESFYIPDDNLEFIGSTLWSNFESNGFYFKNEIKKWAEKNIIDFFSIQYEQQKFTPDLMEKEFNKSYSFLNFSLKNNTHRKKIVITHFAPHKNSIPKEYKDQFGSPYWVNDLNELMGFSDFWIHGHVHHSFSYEIEQTKILCNPRGYSKIFDLSDNKDFNKSLFLSIQNYSKNKKFI